MRKQDKSLIRLIWLIATVACFTLPLVLTPATDAQHWLIVAAENMTFAMFVLSFPGSILFSVVIAIFLFLFSPHDLPVASYLLLWFGFFLTGYVQWFWLIPNLGQKGHLITLGLAKHDETKVTRRRRRRKRVRRARLNNAPISILDAAGRTPLERVIGDS